MSLTVNSNNQNSMTQLTQKKDQNLENPKTQESKEKDEEVKRLQQQQLALQNQKLLSQETSGEKTNQAQKALDEQLEKVSAELKAAMAEGAKSTEGTNGNGISRPTTDGYEKSADKPAEQSPGIYQVTKDENGNTKVNFDSPEKTKDSESGEDKENSPTVVKTTISTDSVDAEIKKIKKSKQNIEQKISQASSDPEERAKLERELASIEAELATKDNDAYRKQHATVSQS